MVQTCHLAKHPDHTLTGWSHSQPAHIAHTQPHQPTPTAVLPCLVATSRCVVFLYASSYCYLRFLVVAKSHIHARICVKQGNLCFGTCGFDFKLRIVDTPSRH